MASNQLQIVIDAVYRGKAAVQQASADVKKLDDNTSQMGQRAPRSWGDFAASVGMATVALGGAYLAGKQLYGVIKEGAALELARGRFDNLSQSINTTGDALLGKLRTATHGMVSDAELIKSATDMMNLGFAKTEQQAIRLTSVAGQLGWNMQQLTLTLANQSTMRLDALGLSVDEVTSRFEELKKQGVAVNDAFQLAVIEAGEAKLGLLGSAAETSAGSLAQAEAAAKNLKDSLLLTAVATLEQVGAFDALRESAQNLSDFSTFTAELTRLQTEGAITAQQAQELTFIIKKAGVEAAQAQLQYMMMNNTLSDPKAWQAYAIGAQVSIELTQEYTQKMLETIPVAQTLMGVLPAMFGPAISAADAFLLKLDAVNAQMAGIDPGVRARGDMRNGYGGLPYVRPNNLKEGWQNEYDEAAAGATRLGGAISATDLKAQELAATVARMAGAFDSEIALDVEMSDDAEKLLKEGLVGDDGLVIMQNVNAALYDQAKAAGASASQLAMLGIATGKFTQEQATAALKAAILQEQIGKIAEAVVAGNMSIGDATGALGQLQVNLDGTQSLEQLQGIVNAIDGTEAAVGVDFDPFTTAVDNEIRHYEGYTVYIDTVFRPVNSPLPGDNGTPLPPPNNPSPDAPSFYVPDAGSASTYATRGQVTNGSGGYSVIFNFNGPVTGAEDVRRAGREAAQRLMYEIALAGGTV